MARAYSKPPVSEDGPASDPEDWHALKGELVALLEEVEGRYRRSQQRDGGLSGLTERMKRLREEAAGGGDRHQEALRTVKRAVDRFSDRDEAPAAPAPDGSRDALEAAINEIRARQANRPLPGSRPAVAPQAATPAPPAPAPAPAQAARPPAPDHGPRIEGLAQSVGGISGRLERLEGDLRTELKAQKLTQGSLKEIAEQVSQVSQVVELLANAVGETGQVKRLEAQIADIARLITDSRQVDISALTQRLEEVSGTVERLADLQIEHVSTEREMPAQQAAIRSGMAAIEESVRTVYDRIDAIERSFVLSPADVEKLTTEMANFTEALTHSVQPQNLIELVDALNQRISEIESRDSEVGGLRDDIAGLRQAVLGTVEPRLAAMQDQIEALNERVAEPQADPGVGQIEAQVRQLVARMDQTGEQLSGLARLFNTPIEQPDFVALADASAARAAQAVLEITPPPPDLEGLADMVALRTFEAVVRADTPPDLVELADMVAARTTRAIAEAAVPPPDLAEFADLVVARMQQVMAVDAVTPTEPPDFAALASLAAAQTLEAVGQNEFDLSLLADMVAERTSQALAKHEPPPPPDFDALAEKVASRTSEAVGRFEPPDYEAFAERVAARTSEAVGRFEATPLPDLQAIADLAAERASQSVARNETAIADVAEASLAEIEARIAKVMRALADERQPEDFSHIHVGIQRVDERLGRLEAALSRLGEENAELRLAAIAVADAPRKQQARPLDDDRITPSAPPAPAAPVADLPASEAAADKDAMPAPPDEDRPLLERPFPDLGPVRAALEARTGRKPTIATPAPAPAAPAPEALVETARTAVDRPLAFDVATIEKPPRPRSSLDTPEFEPVGDNPFEDAAPVKEEAPQPPHQSSRNTFIEAARRAAQRQNPTTENSGSVISRAFERLLPKKKVALVADEPAFFKEEKVEQEETSEARKPETASPVEPDSFDETPHPAPEPVDRLDEESAPSDDPPPTRLSARDLPIMTGPEGGDDSFLIRYRKPILLGASVLALSFLTANLINQRLAEEDTLQAASGEPTAAIASSSDAETAADLPAAGVDIEPVLAAEPVAITPRVIPIVDSVATGSIDSAASRFAPAANQPPAAATFRATDAAAAALMPAAPEGPAAVLEMPPEAIGPVALRESAAAGDARAQFEVAAIYTEGSIVPPDFALAATWYERSAAQSFAPAQYRLGNLYENGRGIEKDLEQARLWYQRAAEAGNRMSMHNLAALHAGGELGKQDFAIAARWFEEAAGLGLTDSQFNLGMLYARGLGVPQNMETSYRWFALAAGRGDEDAAKARDDVARSLDAEAVSRINAEIAGWEPKQIDISANFAPIGTWASDFDPGQQIATREVVVGVQTLLNRLGYDAGLPDGLAGPKTSDAIRAFERATGMSESGAINPRLLAVLSSQPI